MVEIIPKKENKLFYSKDIFFYLSLSLLVGAVLAYALLINFQQNSLTVLNALEQELSRRTTPKEMTLEQEILGYKNKIDDFSSIFAGRKMSSSFFSEMEKLTNPKVWFSGVELNLASLEVGLTGQAESFSALNQQLSAFRGQKGVNEIKLSEIEIEKNGAIGFDLKISFSKELVQ